MGFVSELRGEFLDALASLGSMLESQSVGVAFPYRKSNILDNKLEFSGIKLAES